MLQVLRHARGATVATCGDVLLFPARLDLGNEPHPVHGGDPVASSAVQLDQHGQPQQRGYRVMCQLGCPTDGQLQWLGAIWN